MCPRNNNTLLIKKYEFHQLQHTVLFSLIHQYYIKHLDFLEDYMQQLEHYQYRFVDILSFVYLNLFDFHLKFVQYDKKVVCAV